MSIRTTILVALISVATLTSSHGAVAGEPGGPAFCGAGLLADGPAGTVSAGASVSGDGRWVAFTSDADLLGQNADGSTEVFLLDLATSTTTQISNSDRTSSGPSISGDGSVLAFASSGDLTGDNPDGGNEVFVHERGVGTRQITGLPAGQAAGSPAVSTDGSTVVFASNADLTDENPSGRSRAFAYDVEGGTFDQITTGDPPREESQPSVDADGSVVAFVADDDPILHTTHLVRVEAPSGAERAIADGGDPWMSAWFESNAVLSDDGLQLLFVSHHDWTTDQSHFGDADLYLYDAQADEISRLTDVPALGYDAVRPASISDDGHWVTFGSYVRDPSGTWGTTQVHLVEVASGQVTQVTAAPQGSAAGSPSLSSDASRLVWTTRAVADGSWDLATQECSVRPRDVSAAHPFVGDIVWMGEQGIATGYPDGTYRPAAPVTRQAMAAFLHRLAGSPDLDPPEDPTFADVSATHPFFEPIEWMAAEGISTGTPGTPKPMFAPSTAVSRSAMAAFLHRLADSPELELPDDPTFADVSITHPFFEPIEWMAAVGISTGDPSTPKPTYRPAAPVTRQAMAAFLHRWADGPGLPS